MRYSISLALILLASTAFGSPCSISIGSIPDSLSIGSIIRNPNLSSQNISIPVSISCSNAELIEFSSQNGKFQSLEFPTSMVSYSVRASGFSTSSSFVSAGSPGAFISLGQMSSPVVSGNLEISSVAVRNLQAGNFTERINLRIGGAGGMTSTITLNGQVPADCGISIGSIPGAQEIGEIFKNPQGRSVSVPVSFSCNTYQASVSVSSQNGFFKPMNAANNTQVNYQVKLSEGATVSSSLIVASSAIANNNWMNLGFLAGPSALTNLLVTPETIQNIQADTYSEILYLRVNGP
jgi:hypothetical protein